MDESELWGEYEDATPLSDSVEVQHTVTGMFIKEGKNDEYHEVLLYDAELEALYDILTEKFE